MFSVSKSSQSTEGDKPMNNHTIKYQVISKGSHSVTEGVTLILVGKIDEAAEKNSKIFA